MQYIKVNGDKWVEFDGENLTSRVIVKSEIEDQIEKTQILLSTIPDDPTDEELLVWAKSNYPFMDYSVQRFNLQKVLDENTAVLQQLK